MSEVSDTQLLLLLLSRAGSHSKRMGGWRERGRKRIRKGETNGDKDKEEEEKKKKTKKCWM